MISVWRLLAWLAGVRCFFPIAQLGVFASGSYPILTWVGATSGAQNLSINRTLNFTTPGTYTFTVTEVVRLNLAVGGAGASGQAVGLSSNGGNGGASGAVGTVAAAVFQPGVTYEIRVPAANSGLSAYVKVQGGASLIEMGSGVGRTTPGTVVVGTGVAGANGGLGGTYDSVAPGGAPGSINVSGAGAGGGGGTQGSVVLGGGGSGGGMANGSSDHGTPPGQGDVGGQGLPVLVAGVNTAAGGGGASSGDTGAGGNTAGYQGAAQLVFVP